MNPEAELNDATAIGLVQARKAALLADGVPERRPLTLPHDAMDNVKALLEATEAPFAPGGPAEQVYRPEYLAEVRTQIAGLKADCQTFYGAWLRLRTIEAPGPGEYKETTDALRAWDARLFPWAWAAFHQLPTLRTLLTDIRKGHGPRDDADDVQRLVLLILTHWSNPATLPFPRAELEAAAALATRYLELDRTRPVSAEDRRLRDRAFGVLSQRFNTVRYALIALTQDENQPRLAGR